MSPAKPLPIPKNPGSRIFSKSPVPRAQPAAPTKTDFDFDGWYSDKELTAAYDFSAPVTKDITLYAKWTDNGTVIFTPADNTTDKIFLLSEKKATTTEGATIQYKLGDGSWQDYTVGTSISVTTST